MRPILFDTGVTLPLLGRVDFPSYFTMLALSFAIGMWMTGREAPKLGLDKHRIGDLNLWIVVWAIIGARVLHVLADGHLGEYVNLCLDPVKVTAHDARVVFCQTDAQCGYDYLCSAVTHRCHPPRDCLAAAKVWSGGLAYYGGFVFASVFGLWYARKHRLGMGRVADLTAPWIAFGLALTRLGCFLNGCCYGHATELPWGARFPMGSVVHEMQVKAGLVAGNAPALPVHPAQLYLAALNLLTFALLYFVWRPRKRFDGELFAWFLVCKGVFRSVVEIWRDDERGVFFGGHVSTSQLISIPLVALGVWMLLRRRAPVTDVQRLPSLS